jgi:hypothetical protein
MPKIVTPENAKDKWNFYFPQGLKLDMHLKLLKLGQQRKQSALIRALIRMFVNGDIDENKVISLIDEETYIKQDGTTSIL